MAGIGFLKVHRTWEDYADMLLGVLIGISPWLAGEQYSQLIMGNAILVGALIILLAQLELTNLHRWEEAAEIILGLWLIASPYVLGYAGNPLAWWHYGLGAIVVLLSLFELWQDWNLGDNELARHGQ